MRIDWTAIDPLVELHLPSMTCAEFCRQFAASADPRSIGARAKHLGVAPAKRTTSASQKAAISTSVKQRKVWRIDWSGLDDLIKSQLPQMTVAQFQRVHGGASAKQIAKRAIKLGVTPGRAVRDENQRRHIAERIRQYRFTPEQDDYMRQHKDDMGQVEIAAALGVSQMAIWRRMGELGIKRDNESLHAMVVRQGVKYGHLGGEATATWVRSMSSDEYAAHRQRMSGRMTQLMKEGKIKPGRGIGQEMHTTKGGTFKTRSSYETRYVELLESDPLVTKFEYEPLTIEYDHDGILKHYTPDFLVFYVDHVELVEVKPKRMLDFERNPAKFKTARQWCMGEGLAFVIVTEDVLGLKHK